MANLKELKGKEQYKGIRVTDDYTIKYINTIKEWIERARTHACTHACVLT